MEGLEDGELPSSPDELQPNLEMEQTGAPVHPIYTPLPRPQVSVSTKTSNNTPASENTLISAENINSVSESFNKSDQKDLSKTYSFSSSDSYSSDDSDSDNQVNRNWPGARPPGKKSRKLRMQQPNVGVQGAIGDHGEDFKMAAAAYQNSLRANNGALPTSGFSGGEKRKSSSMNNVWGSILREDALTSELTGIAVGRKSAKDLNSDRGAEAYDYSVAAEYHAATRQEEETNKRKATEQKLDDDLGDYWTKGPKEEEAGDDMETGGRRKEDAICAGKKRSAKERLGTKNSNYLPRHKVGYGGDGQTQDSNALEDMSIPQPGVARTIPDLSPEVIKNIFPKNASLKDNELGRNLKGQVEHMEEESGNDGILQDSNSPSRYAEVLGEELAARLCEPKTELMIGVVRLVGAQVVLELFQKTQKIESEGGMMINDGARRRTAGGVFLHLLRGINDDSRVDSKKVKQFFAHPQKRKRNHHEQIAQSQKRNNFYEEPKINQRSNVHQQKSRGFQRYTNRHPYKKTYVSYQKPKHANGEGPKKEDNFQHELEALRKLSQKVKNESEKGKNNPNKLVEHPVDMEDEDEKYDIADNATKVEDEKIKPLPDILACTSKQTAGNIQEQSRGPNNTVNESIQAPVPFTSSSSSHIVTQHDLLASCQPSTSSEDIED